MRTQDGVIQIETTKLGDSIFPAADFTMANIPIEQGEAEDFLKNLYNIPVERHILLLFCRHSREDKTKALANIHAGMSAVKAAGIAAKTPGAEWNFLDSVSVWYEKPSTSSNIGLLPVSEEAFIFYKGAVPNIKNTSWFGSGSPNATTTWGVSPAEYEKRAHTYYRKFSWEVALLMATMSDPAQTGRFIYALDGDYEHVFKFCREYGQQTVVYIGPDESAAKLMETAQNSSRGENVPR